MVPRFFIGGLAIMVLFIMVLFLFLQSDAPPRAVNQPTTRNTVPDATAQMKALSEIKEVYKPFPPETTSDKAALVKRLLSDGRQTNDDLNAKYVMLDQAAQLACSIDDFSTATQAIDDLAAAFAIDPLSRKLEMLRGVKVNRLSPIAATEYGEATLPLGWQSIRAGEFDGANQAAALAMLACSVSGEQKLAQATVRLTVNARNGQVDAQRARAAEAQLKANPSDASACLTEGRFLCLWRDDWKAGLPLLAEGSDATVKAIAAADLAQPTTADAQFHLAEKWYGWSNQETDLPHDQLRKRALQWYLRADSGLSGLKNLLADKRIANADTPDQNEADVFGSKELTLTRLLNDPSHWKIVSGEWITRFGRLQGTGDSRIDFDQPLPPNITFSVRINVISGMRPRMFFGGTDVMFGNEGYTNNLFPQGAKTSDPSFSYQNNQPHILTFSIGGDRFDVAIDGKPAFKCACKPASEIHLKLRGGDWYSPGTTEFSDFDVESPPQAPN